MLSAWLGFVGMTLMLPAFYSFYRMIEETCGRILKVMATFMAVYRGIKFKRTKSVAEGDDCCDYRYTRVK